MLVFQMGTTKSLLMYFFGLLGLCGFGTIVFEIIKKWQFIDSSLSPVWIIAPILILFSVRQATRSSYWTNKLNVAPDIVKRITLAIND